MPPLTTLLPLAGAGEQAQRQQQRALDDVLHGCHKMSSHQIQNERKKAGVFGQPSL